MKKFNCFIVDDEPLAIKVIEQHLSKIPSFEVCGKTTDPLAAFEQIKMQRPDLLFIDIEMPGITGMELIATLQHKPAIVITTAYREYAVEGFDLNVLDYLVKPIPFPRFLKAIDKFLEKQTPASPALPEPESFIYIKADRQTVRLLPGDICYAEGIKDYTRIVLADKKIMTKVSIGNFWNLLPEGQFIRVHKSFIVAQNRISRFTASEVEVNGVSIPVGRMYRKGLMEEMDKKSA